MVRAHYLSLCTGLDLSRSFCKELSGGLKIGLELGSYSGSNIQIRVNVDISVGTNCD